MNKEKDPKKQTFSQWFWKEGDYIDFWNIPHTFFGALFFCICFSSNIPLALSLILLIILKVAWEIYENNQIIHETLANSILDIISGIIGFFLSYYLISQYPKIFYSYFIVVFILFSFFSIWGLLNLEENKRVKK